MSGVTRLERTTERLLLVASTLDHLRAELASPAKLASLLNVEVPSDWPPGEYDRSAQEFFLKQAKVALNEGREFGPGGEGFVRLNFGCPRLTLVEALGRMKSALDAQSLGSNT